MRKVKKRRGYLSWDEAFIQLCYLIAKRSKDPNTQTGACVVDSNNIIVSIGYNGFPRGCSDDKFPWSRDGNFVDTKYAYVVHGEANAVLNATCPIGGYTLYCTLFPCNECAKIIIQKGIKKIIYVEDKYHDEPQWVAARRMFNAAGVKYLKYVTEYELELKKKG